MAEPPGGGEGGGTRTLKGQGCLPYLLGVKNVVFVLLGVFSLKSPQRVRSIKPKIYGRR